jgi:hypothetical protein
MAKIALLTSCLLAGCTHTPELTVMWGPRRSEGHHDTALTLMLMQRIGKHGIGGCIHQSEPQHGAPVNNDEETTFDSCGLGARWGGKPK